MLHRYAESVRAFERALSLSPDLYGFALDRGWIYLRWQGQFDTLRAALNRLPKDADLGGMRGRVADARADLLLWERNADSLLQVLRLARVGDFTQ